MYEEMIRHFKKNPDELKRLRKQYEEALSKNEYSFVFIFPWGQEWKVLTSYIRYLIEFLEG